MTWWMWLLAAAAWAGATGLIVGFFYASHGPGRGEARNYRPRRRP